MKDSCTGSQSSSVTATPAIVTLALLKKVPKEAFLKTSTSL